MSEDWFSVAGGALDGAFPVMSDASSRERFADLGV